MPPMQKDLQYVGLGVQTAKGAAATTPVFSFGTLGGKVHDAGISQDYEAQTLNGGASDRFAVGVNRTGALPAASFRSRAYARSIVYGLYGVLGAKATTGAASPYQHVLTPAQTLPYFTMFGRFASEYLKLVDCKVNEVTISWDERNPLEVEWNLLGITPTYGTASWTATTDELANPFYGPVGGTLQLDTGSATPAAAQIKAASVKISSGVSDVPLSKSILPDDLMEATQTVEGTVTLIPNDLTDWKKIVTGTGSGTAIASSPTYGSLSLKVTIDANNDLTLAANRVEFLADFPEGDAGGGPAEVALAFRVVRPTDTSAAFTATAHNAQASY